MQNSDARKIAVIAAAVTAVSAILITVETSRRRLREREASGRRKQYRLPVRVAPGPDFDLESFNDTWALQFLGYHIPQRAIEERMLPWIVVG